MEYKYFALTIRCFISSNLQPNRNQNQKEIKVLPPLKHHKTPKKAQSPETHGVRQVLLRIRPNPSPLNPTIELTFCVSWTGTDNYLFGENGDPLLFVRKILFDPPQIKTVYAIYRFLSKVLSMF